MYLENDPLLSFFHHIFHDIISIFGSQTILAHTTLAHADSSTHFEHNLRKIFKKYDLNKL